MYFSPGMAALTRHSTIVIDALVALKGRKAAGMAM